MIVIDASVTAFALLDEGTAGDRCRAALAALEPVVIPTRPMSQLLSNVAASCSRPMRA